MKKSLAFVASAVMLMLLARPASPRPTPAPQAQVTVTLNPTVFGLAASQSLTLFATVTNDPQKLGVTWTVSGGSCSGSACGVFTQTTSTSTQYTAPAAGGVYLITATSVANSAATASAQIAVTDIGGVYTYRYNLTSAGVNGKEYLLNPSNVNSTSFGKLFSCVVDETVYAQPLWVANVPIAGGVHNIVIVATQNDSVYAFDADGANGTACVLYWQASLLGQNYGATTSNATPIPPVDTGETGDIPTNIGITSTPVIDSSTNILYVESNTKENSNYFQRLHALNLSTGAENTGWPITIAPSVPGTGQGSSGGTLPFIPLHENQRPGLALVNGSVYMAFASHGDVTPWHGWVIGYNTSTRALSGAFATTPNSNGGGIWMAGSAPAVDSSNNLYVITSNGTYDGKTEFGDSFLKLSTSGGVALAGSTATATFTPDDQASLSSGNLDLGQGGAITLLDSVSGPTPHLLVGGGKEGVLYLLNRDNMGGYSASNNNGALQTWSLGGGGSNYAGVASAGTFWQNTFYIAGSAGAMQAYAFNTATDLFNTNPTSQSTNTFPFPGATPEISASGTSNAILWAVDTSGNGTNGQSTGPAVLYAYDATNVKTQFWNSTQNTPQGGSNQAPNAVKFVIPTVANGKVYVGGVNSFVVYGLLNLYNTAAPPTFSPAPGSYSSPVNVTLSDAAGDTIYYTTDGTFPTTSSKVYSGPINISATTTIRAMATGPGLGSSAPVTGSYTIGASTITYVQGYYATPQSSQTSVTLGFLGAQTAGDLNVVVVGWNDSTASVSSVVDSSGNSYALAVGPTKITGSLSQSIYYAKNIVGAAAGANTVAVTFSQAAAYPDIRILEYSGADPSTPVDVTAANTGNSTSSSSGAVTTTNAADMLFGANIVTSVTGGPGAGFTSRLLTSPDGDIAEDEMVTATGSYSATAPLSSGGWIMQLVAFRVAGSGSGGTLPTVSSVSPNSGPAAGGTAVTISGTNFAAGASVTFGSAAATNVVVTNGTTITATTPAGSAGAVTVTVTVNGQNGSLPNGFTYVVPPTVSSVSPNTGPTSGGTAVTIMGTNFAAGAAVTFGSAAATNVVVTSGTTITATTPAGSVGAVTVTVTNPGSQSGSLTNGFTYAVLPTVSSVSPNSGPAAGGTAVTITGTNFASGATVKFGSAAATNVVVTNSTTITATTPAGSAGAVTVTVTVNGQNGSLTNGFTYVVPPTVTSISPNSGPAAGGTAVTITGTNFAAGATVTFGSAAATNVVVTNSTTITAKTPAGSVGAVTVTVTNTGSQSGSLANGFTYVTATTISYVQGNYATPQTSQTSVPVKFNAAQTLGDLNVVVVGWNDTTAAVSSVVDSSGNTYALAVGPTAISGTLSQSIYYAKKIVGAAAGANTVTVTFTTAAAYPDIRILEYNGADPNTPVDVTAANTGNGTSSSSGSTTTTNATDLIFGANMVTSVTTGPGSGFTSRLLTSPDEDIAEDEMVSSTGSYSATAPLSSGAWIMQMVAFRTPSGGPAPPTVSSISPNNGPASGGTAVTITGTNFAAGATVTFGSAAATNVSVTNSTTISATTPAGSAGAVTVTVMVNGQNGSLPNGFTYVVPPTVSSVSPGSGSTSGGTGVTITGTNFVAGATVTFGSAAATNVVVANSTTITATTPAGTAGAVAVTVTVSGQSGSLASGFTYVVGPTVGGVSPATGPGAGGTGVTITGTNFAAGATVTFGSSAATNVVVTNSTTITATTPAGSAGAVTVTVTVNGVNGSLANAFTYIVPPTVNSVTPNTGSTSGGTAVTIGGANFAAGATVTFGSSAATNVVVTSSTTITATTPAGSVGSVTVTVTNTGSQSGSLANGYTYASVPTPTAPTNFTAIGGGPAPIVANVQSYINSTALTSHTTAPFDSTGGDVIVICASSHAGVSLTPSDSFGNTWIPIAGPTNTTAGFDLRTELWYARNPVVGSGHTVTMTLSAAQSLVISIFIVKGSNRSSPIDAISLIGSDNGTQTVNVASPNITTSNANDLLIGFVKVSAGASFTSGAGFTQQPAASSNFLDAESGSAASAGTYDATFTISSAQTWQSAVTAIANNTNQASLSWTASTEVGGTISEYLIERCAGAGCGSFVQIGTTTGTTFNDTGLTASTSYSYRVRAQDTSNVTGPYSNVASFTTAPSVPALPGNLTANAVSGTQINLSWLASAETGGTISNYLVERCQGANCTNFAQIGTATATAYNDTGLSRSASYTYRVRASDSAGHLSPYSNLAIANTGIVYVQGNYATPQSLQTTVAVTFNGAQTAGDLSVVVVGWNDTTAAVSSVVDSSGNTYALAVGPTKVSAPLSQSIYYAKNIAAAAAGANTVTVTFNRAAAYPDIRILEYSGADPTSPVDVTAANTGNSASSSSGSVTTTNATDLLFGANMVFTTTTGPGSGFTSRLLTSPDGDIAEDEMVTTTGSYSTSAPLSSGGAWIMQLVAFKAAP